MYGALVIVLAFFVQHLGTLLEASNSVIGLVGGPLLGLFLLGILVPRATARGALAGWVAGVVRPDPDLLRDPDLVPLVRHDRLRDDHDRGLPRQPARARPRPRSRLDGLTWSTLKSPEADPAEQPA